MSLSREEVLHVAALARLELSEEEIATFTRQLSEILDYVEQLAEVDLGDVAPTLHVSKDALPLRADEPVPSLAPEDALANAPDQHQDYFRVPKVLDQGSK